MKQDDQTAAKIQKAFTTYIRIAGAAFVISGLVMFLATSGTDRLLVKTEPLLEVQNATFLWLGGAFHLVAGGLLLAPLDELRRCLLALWAGTWHLIYFIGMVCMKVATPFPAVQLVGWKIGANNPRIVDIVWRFFILYLLIGGSSYLVWEWRRTKRRAAADYLDEWKHRREEVATGVHNASQPVKPPAEKPMELAPAKKLDVTEPDGALGFKLGCPHCGQHVRCDADYAGRQVECPACKKPFRVPAAIRVPGGSL